MNANALLDRADDLGRLQATRPAVIDLRGLQVNIDAVILEAMTRPLAGGCICVEPVRRGPICVVRYSRFFINSEWAVTSLAIFRSASSIALR